MATIETVPKCEGWHGNNFSCPEANIAAESHNREGYWQDGTCYLSVDDKPVCSHCWSAWDCDTWD